MSNAGTSAGYTVYVGTYGGGIYCFDYDPEGGPWTPRGVTALENPSYLCASADGRFLYAVIETGEFEGEYGGAVAAFAIGPGGALTALNSRGTAGLWPCHLTVDDDRGALYAANYGDGTVSAFPLAADGSIGPRSPLLRHVGSGPDRDRQEGPHAHCVTLSPCGRRLHAVDLGADRVFTYTIGPGGALQAEEAFALRPGFGPRHMVFHPSGKYAYVLAELGNEALACVYDGATGRFTALSAVSTLPEGFSGESYCAALRLSGDGRTLYASNRGHDSVAVFAVEPDGGLAPLGHTATDGSWPRDIALGPEGRFLFAACERSGCVTAFTVEPGGRLSPLGQAAAVPQPTSILFVPKGR